MGRTDFSNQYRKCKIRYKRITLLKYDATVRMLRYLQNHG